MTEEEAIAYGKRVIELGLNDETQAFCELAIKALEQEPTTKNDLGVGCISRIETIDYLCKHCPDDGECFKDCDEIKHLRQMPSVTPQEPNTWSLDDAREDFMHDVYNELDFLPTNDEANRIIDSFDMVTKCIKQEPRWIPVAERLPQESRMFLVTLVDKEDDYVCIDVAWYAHPNDYSIEFGEWREVPTSEKVIAWMQLPEPYKGE